MVQNTFIVPVRNNVVFGPSFGVRTRPMQKERENKQKIEKKIPYKNAKQTRTYIYISVESIQDHII